MSENPQLESDASKADVSRETKEASVSPELVMLNEIMDRSMDDSQVTPQEKAEQAAQEDTSPPEEKGDLHSPSKKSKPASTYIYLAVLFGAAFLMLLLAYFVQQRNNASVWDDLRSTTASREELLENIKALEAENAQLQADLDRQRTLTDNAKQEKEGFQAASDKNWENFVRVSTCYDYFYILDCLEQFNRSGDYLMSAVVVSNVDGIFNKNSPYEPDLKYLTPAQEAQYMDLREELFDKSGFMILRSVNGSLLDLPAIAEGTFDTEVLDTAQSLWGVIHCYAASPDYAAMLLANNSQGENSSLKRVNSEVFKKSTVDLFEAIKTDLIAQGQLMEEDGVLIAVNPPEGGLKEDMGGPD